MDTDFSECKFQNNTCCNFSGANMTNACFRNAVDVNFDYWKKDLVTIWTGADFSGVKWNPESGKGLARTLLAPLCDKYRDNVSQYIINLISSSVIL
jgi:hypothetical protein